MIRYPQLFTPRLHLRKLEYEDLTALVKYANNKVIADNIVNIPFPYREPDAAFRLSAIVQGFKNQNRHTFAIILKERQELIGEISIQLLDKTQKHGQVAYWIGEPFWNQGIMTEAVAAVLKYGFKDLDLDLIYGDCKEENHGSVKVLTKNGMQEHGRNGGLVIYSLQKEDFDLGQ